MKVLEREVLHLVVGAARPAERVRDLVGRCLASGFRVCVVPSPVALQFIGDPEPLEQVTGYPVIADFLLPEACEPVPPPSAVLVCPLTFDMLNKWGSGIADTLAVARLCESLGLDVPVAAIAWFSAALARHPATTDSISTLEREGVQFFNLRTGSGEVAFDPALVEEALTALRRGLGQAK